MSDTSGPPLSPSITKGNFVFTSGQVYLTADGTLLNGSVEDQVRQIMQNLERVLKNAGASFADVVKTTVYTTDMALYGDINRVYAGYFKPPYPAREVVCVKELPLGARIEISMVAYHS